MDHYEAPKLVDPLEASRHPFETYLLLLAAVSGVPLMFGKPNSASIAATLPHTLVVGWGVMLVIGSTLALIGLYWRGRSSTGLVLERAGLIGVGGASVVYASSVMLSAPGFTGSFAASITVGFGVACFVQARRISARLRTAIDQMLELHTDMQRPTQ